jgi:hypothetical protein
VGQFVESFAVLSPRHAIETGQSKQRCRARGNCARRKPKVYKVLPSEKGGDVVDEFVWEVYKAGMW